MNRNRLIALGAVAVLMAVSTLVFGADLGHASLVSLAAGPLLMGEMEVDMKSILEAIDKSNRAFEGFKSANDERLKLIEKGVGGQSELQVKMEKAFADMAEQKAVLEKLEAKLKRPLIGSDGKALDEQAEAHRAAFKGWLTRGTGYDQSELFYQGKMGSQEAVSVKSLLAGSGPDGGFAVPKVIDGMIEALIVNVSPIRAIASVQQISTQDFHKLVDLRGTSSGWVGETATRSSTNTPQFADVSPPMGEIYANPQATQVMLDDVFFNAEQWLSESVSLEFSRAEGAAFVSGTGVAQPRGFTSYTTAATADATRAFGTLEHVATGTSGAFKTLTSTVNPVDDLYTLVSKLKKGYRAGSGWVMNKNTLFAIMAMKDYQGRYVFTPTQAPDMSDMILNYPITEAEDMPDYTTGSALAVAFGNFKRGYLIVDRVGTRVIRDPFSNKPYIGFYTTKRLGGGVVNSEAIKFLKFA